jgi:YHS domain-containing protein
MADQMSEHDVWTDPVTHRAVDPEKSQHRSFYDGKMYHFTDLTSKQTFDADPQLWAPTPHASETSAHITPTGQPMAG